tara:strand:+ start:692 stop:889 length:198 start_codon:yes stop_codon:yes gene_type:complete
MTVILLVVVLLSPSGLYKSVASVVEACPPKAVIIEQLERDVAVGIITGYWATCAPIKITQSRRKV